LGSWRSTIELHPQENEEMKVTGERRIVKDQLPRKTAGALSPEDDIM
jgi:hypothetical protein